MGVVKEVFVLKGYLLKFLGLRVHGWEADLLSNLQLLSNDSEKKVYVRVCLGVQWHRQPQIKQMVQPEHLVNAGEWLGSLYSSGSRSIHDVKDGAET